MNKKYSGKAIAAFVLSLVGIFFAGLICGVIGIVLGAIAINETSKNPMLKGFGISVAGLIISIADCVLMIVSLATGAVALF